MPSNHWGLSKCQIERTIVDCRNWAFLPMTDFDRWAKATDWWISCSKFFQEATNSDPAGSVVQASKVLVSSWTWQKGKPCSRSSVQWFCNRPCDVSCENIKLWSFFMNAHEEIKGGGRNAFRAEVWALQKLEDAESVKIWERQIKWQAVTSDKWRQVMASHTGHRCCEARSDSCFLGCWQREAPCHDELLGCFMELKGRQIKHCFLKSGNFSSSCLSHSYEFLFCSEFCSVLRHALAPKNEPQTTYDAFMALPSSVFGRNIIDNTRLVANKSPSLLFLLSVLSQTLCRVFLQLFSVAMCLDTAEELQEGQLPEAQNSKEQGSFA